jgi:hypothetical protein
MIVPAPNSLLMKISFCGEGACRNAASPGSAAKLSQILPAWYA